MEFKSNEKSWVEAIENDFSFKNKNNIEILNTIAG